LLTINSYDLINSHSIEPAWPAILGQSSAHSLATGPVMADPFISPFGLIITSALSKLIN
jgi:hypothetical protein